MLWVYILVYCNFLYLCNQLTVIARSRATKQSSQKAYYEDASHSLAMRLPRPSGSQ